MTTTLTGTQELKRGVLALGLERGFLEIKQQIRNKQALFFTLLFPVMLLVLFGAIFGGGKVEGTNVELRQVFIAGIIASGVMSASFSSLAIGIALERDEGMLKRLAVTPMPKAAYFLGKLVMTMALSIAELVVMLAVGVLLYGLDLPATATKWLTLVWVLVLGNLSCSLLGIAYSRLARNGRSAAAVVQPPYIALQFISGVFFVFSNLSKPLQTVAAIFPLKWMAQGMRSVFLPDSFARVEPAGSWEQPRVALVLGAWTVGAFVLCTLTWRWQKDGR